MITRAPTPSIPNTNYSGAFRIPSGQWQDSPDPNAGWRDPHGNAFGKILQWLDPTTSHGMLGDNFNTPADYVHKGGQVVVDKANQYLSPVVGALQQVNRYVNPWINSLKNTGVGQYVQGIEDFAKNKPVDTLALLAASYFGGGALAGAAGGGAGAGAGAAGAEAGAGAAAGGASAGAAAAPAASGGAGAVGGAGAITGSAGSAAITPALAYGGAAEGATTGSGILGAASTSLGPASGAAAGTGAESGLFSGASKVLSNPYLQGALKIKNMVSSFNDFAQANKRQYSQPGLVYTGDNMKPIEVKKVGPLDFKRFGKTPGMR